MRVATATETRVQTTHGEPACHESLEVRIDAIVAEAGLLQRQHPFDRRPVAITPAEFVRRMAPFLSLN